MARRKPYTPKPAHSPHRTPKPRPPPAPRRIRRPACRHCGQVRYLKNKGLCNPCYYNPEITKLYGSVDPRGKRQPDNRRHARRLAKPTVTHPGSTDRVDVMVERVEAGRALWNPADARE